MPLTDNEVLPTKKAPSRLSADRLLDWRHFPTAAAATGLCLTFCMLAIVWTVEQQLSFSVMMVIMFSGGVTAFALAMAAQNAQRARRRLAEMANARDEARLNRELRQRVQERTSELNREHKLLQSILDNISDGLAVLDARGRLLQLNPAARRVLDVPSDRISAEEWQRLFDVLQPDTRMPFPEERRPLYRALRGETVRDVEMIIRNDGNPEGRAVSVSAAPLLGDDGVIAGAVAVFRDISERKKTEEILKQHTQQVEAANKELEAFSYSVSHDLRAPLRAMDGFSRILMEEHAATLPDDARELLSDIRTSARQMGQLIDDLLAFSRLSRHLLDSRLIDMDKLVRQCVDDVRSANRERNVDVTFLDLPVCRGDTALLRQVWLNLLSNAFKYSRKCNAPHVEVGSFRRGAALVYYVKDNGVGFDMRYAKKLFGVFQRLHRAEEYEGTGVGLAIVQRIIHRHGGRVWAEAEPGKGATFCFTLQESQ